MSEYYKKNKEIILQNKREYYKNNKEAKLEYQKNYYKNNKEARQHYQKMYIATPEGLKKQMIAVWKHRGVVCDDFDGLYDIYTSTNECEVCKTNLTKGSGLIGKKCLDHDHSTGEFRAVLCGVCNITNKKI